MVRSYLMYALYYLKKWNTSVAFASINGRPLHPWRIHAEKGMTIDELESYYFNIASKKQSMRVAILTGPYMSKIEKPMAIIDVDSPPIKSKKEKMDIMKSLSRTGYTVVNTPRGFHVHAFLSKGEKLPYILGVVREIEGKKKTIGEGGVLFPHPWTSPPSQRNLGENGWFTYGFVLPNGDILTKYDIRKIKDIEPPEVSLSDLIDDLELYLSSSITTYNPMVSPSVKLPSDNEEETTKKNPLFYDLNEFTAYLGELLLPRCVAWIMYHYVTEGMGDPLAGSRLLAMYIDGERMIRKVPLGKRFLVASVVALFLSHVIEFIKFDEILNVLSYGIEGWPDDDGGSLDQKLKYLFLADQEGYVYPRYSGLGSLTPITVLGQEFCTELCPLSRICQARSPWRAFRRFNYRIVVSKQVYDYSSPPVDE